MMSKKIATVLVRHPKMVLIVFTLLTLLVGSQALNVYMISDLSGYLPADHPSLQLWDQINEEFQIGSTIMIFVEADDIRDPYVLIEMDRVSSKVNQYDLDHGDLDGVVSIRSIANLIKKENAKPKLPGGLGGSGKFEMPTDSSLISTYMARSLVQQTEGLLFIDNFEVAVVIIQLSDDADYSEVLSRVEAAIDREARYSDMMVTGLAAMQRAIQEESMQSLLIVFPIAIALISGVIFFFQRTLKGIIIVFLPLTYALTLTFGVIAVVNPALTLLSIAVVALLIGLGVDYSIHILNRFAEESTVDDKVNRVSKTLKLTGKAVLLSSITTIIGFGSLLVSSMPPIITFGFACVIGIMFCFISATIVVPCLALVLKYEKNGHTYEWKRVSRISITNKKRFALLAVFLAVMSLVVLPQIKTDVSYLELAPEGIPEVEKYVEYAEIFGGGTNVNLMLVETNYQGLTYPETIEAIYKMEARMRAAGATVTSVADALYDVNEVLNRNQIIEKIADIGDAEEIIFNSIAREGLVNEDYSKTVLIITFPVGLSAAQLGVLVDEMNTIASETYIPHGGRISRLTGQDAINVEINQLLTDEQTRSMIIALLLVLSILILIFNSSLWGFLTMIPVIFVLIWEPGFLVITDIPLSVLTISIASIMIGIGIDYGIHITQRVREEMELGLSKMKATERAIEKTGFSLVEASATTIAGLCSVYFVDIPALQQFGTIVIIMTASSLAAAIFVLPIFYSPRFVK